MATVAREYCTLVDDFSGFGRDRAWLSRMSRLLPRLHVAVIALAAPGEFSRRYRFPDDDARCELYMRLHATMGEDILFRILCGDQRVRHKVCDYLADDFTDMYFDLKQGLRQMDENPRQAMEDWQCSFYLHWGRHLLDAEFWLHTVGSRVSPQTV
jgi:hypothetical protein